MFYFFFINTFFFLGANCFEKCLCFWTKKCKKSNFDSKKISFLDRSEFGGVLISFHIYIYILPRLMNTWRLNYQRFYDFLFWQFFSCRTSPRCPATFSLGMVMIIGLVYWKIKILMMSSDVFWDIQLDFGWGVWCEGGAV